MSNNIPILLIGGAALAAGVYFLTKRRSIVEVAREQRQEAIRRGGPTLQRVTLDDPPLQGAMVAEGFNIERRGDWSREDPKFILSGTGATFTTFDHRREFKAPANHPLWGSDVCPSGCVLYRPGSNPNAKYPSEFVETSKGIAAILGTIGQGVTGAFQAQSQFDVEKARLKAGGGAASAQPQIIMQGGGGSNTTLIVVILVAGLGMAAMMFMMMGGEKVEAGA